jgi:hypothetical protein
MVVATSLLHVINTCMHCYVTDLCIPVIIVIYVMHGYFFFVICFVVVMIIN